MKPRLFSSDTAENSIMQTISIAVSAILIASGLITAPSLINNARDLNAKTDVSNIGSAQGFVASDTGSYAPDIASLTRPGGPKLTLSGNPDTSLIAGVDCYGTFVKSTSGSFFYGQSDRSGAFKIQTPWPSAKPATYPSNCQWPMSSTNSVAQVITNAIPNSAATTIAGWASRWFGSVAGAGTVSLIPNGGPNGNSALRKTWTAASTGGQDIGFNSPKGPASAGKSYVGGGWIKSSVATSGRAFIEWFDSSGASLGANVTGSTIAMPANTWTRLITTIPHTAPAGTASGSVIFGAYPDGGGNVPIGTTMDHTMAMLEEGTMLHDYSDANTPGWSLNAAGSSSGKPYTLDSVAGEPAFDETVSAASNQPTNLNLAAGEAWTAYLTMDVTSTLSAGMDTRLYIGDIFNDTVANTYSILRSQTAGDLLLRRTGGTGIMAPGSGTVGRHVVALGINAASTATITVDRGTTFTDTAPMSYIPKTVRMEATSPNTSTTRLVIVPGAYNPAIASWFANHYGTK